MTNLFKKGIFFLLALTATFACSDDDDTSSGGDSTEITNVDFIITTENDKGTMVGVSPSSNGGTAYSIDFGDTSATNNEDVKTSAGPKVSYTYPDGSASYDIVVTASSSTAVSVSATKTHTVVFEAATVLVDFEDDAAVAVTLSTIDDGVITSVENATDNANSAYGKVGKIIYEEEGTGWKSFNIKPTKNIDLSAKSVITMDIYLEADTPSIPVVIKMSDINTDDATAFTKIEKIAMTTATTTAGWQTLSFDLSTASMAGDGSGDNLILTEFGTIILFTGVTLDGGANVAGTYEIDNIAGAEWGSDINFADTDGDGIIDTEDTCPNEAVELDGSNDTNGDGCIDPPTTERNDSKDNFEGNGNVVWSGDGATTLDADFANPWMTGVNTSATILKYNDNKELYANIRFDLIADHTQKFDLTTKNIFTVKVYVPTPNTAVTQPMQLALKLQDGSSGTPWVGQSEVIQPYVYDTWQELTFDFSGNAAATNFSRLVVQFNGENNTEDVEAYIDDMAQN
tara:strand:+ start:15281 stop:16819 length:1539 start_codon:yes stop_codon:yes gene_type:complete